MFYRSRVRLVRLVVYATFSAVVAVAVPVIARARHTSPTTLPPAAPAAPDPTVATVIRVIDGDTIVVAVADVQVRVRLIGIDTPEVTPPAQCYANEASAHTAVLLPAGTMVRLESDLESTDRYGRQLAYVYRTDDALFVNDDLAAGGFARALTIRPNVAHRDELAASIDTARNAGLGLWSAC